jgi:hypothetical protein
MWALGSTQEFHIRVGVVQGTLVPGFAPTPTFTDVLPAGVAFAGYTGQPDWQCTVSGAVVSCTYVGSPAVAGSMLPPVRIRVHVTGPADMLRNCAEAGPDLDPGNNRSCVEVGVTSGALLSRPARHHPSP